MQENFYEEELETWLRAGRIGAEAREYARTLIKPGVSLVEVAEKVEEKIRQLGGVPAFPVQLSLNSFAAHYCPDIEDKTLLKEEDLVKVDLGVSVEGCISDTAFTAYLGSDEKILRLISASQNALKNAAKEVKFGAEIGRIGRIIQDSITSLGFSPVRNLSGHGLGKFQIHTSPTIPNFAVSSKSLFSVQAVAIEPFATDGVGIVEDSGVPNVFALTNKKPVRDPITRKVLSLILEYNGLPFARRWLEYKFSKGEVNFALRNLLRDEIITEYPPLAEISNGMVSQAEHTFLILKDKTIMSTE
ncbi:MAG: type II methionyl aminopeptidase [Candidatus Woesearchaeota archaeon]